MKRLRNSLFVGGAVLLAVAVGAVAWAYWAAPGSGTAQHSLATLVAPSKPVATPTSGSNPVDVAWNPGVVAPNGATVDGYFVERYDGSNWSAACSSSSASLLGATSTACDDTVPASGTYSYRVTAVFRTWTSVSAVSDATNVQLDAIPPTTGAPIVSAATTFGTNPLFVTNEALNITDNAADTGGSGLQSVAYYYCNSTPATCTATDWVSLGSSTNVAGSFPITWATPLPADGSYRIVAVATDNANNVGIASSPATITIDTAGATATAPGVQAAHTSGSNPVFVSNEAVTLTDTPTDGSGSGVQSVTYSYCTDNGSGGCAGPATQIGSSSASGANFAVTWGTPLPTDGTYRITATATDNLGAVGSTSSATLVAVDKTPPAVSRPTVNGHS